MLDERSCVPSGYGTQPRRRKIPEWQVPPPSQLQRLWPGVHYNIRRPSRSGFKTKRYLGSMSHQPTKRLAGLGCASFFSGVEKGGILAGRYPWASSQCCSDMGMGSHGAPPRARVPGRPHWHAVRLCRTSRPHFLSPARRRRSSLSLLPKLVSHPSHLARTISPSFPWRLHDSVALDLGALSVHHFPSILISAFWFRCLRSHGSTPELPSRANTLLPSMRFVHRYPTYLPLILPRKLSQNHD